jgi:hypothetical protein
LSTARSDVGPSRCVVGGFGAAGGSDPLTGTGRFGGRAGGCSGVGGSDELDVLMNESYQITRQERRAKSKELRAWSKEHGAKLLALCSLLLALRSFTLQCFSPC